MNKIVRFFTMEEISLADPNEEVYDSLNVIRSTFSKELLAFFIRSKAGTLLYVNDILNPEEQGKVIKFISKEIDKCGIAEAGVLKVNFEYYCGGTCCDNRYRPAI